MKLVKSKLLVLVIKKSNEESKLVTLKCKKIRKINKVKKILNKKNRKNK